MKKIIFSLSLLLTISYGFSQDLIWSEDFENAGGTWTLNEELPGATNDAGNSNLWVISDAEGGVLPPGCGEANNGNKTLHVSCQSQFCAQLGASGAAYDAGGLIGDTETDKRTAMTTGISTIAASDLELKFDWIGLGEVGADYAELEYSTDGGNTWTVLWTQELGNLCPTGQGEWAEKTIALPAGLEEQADLRFAFRWVNNNNGVGTDPSFAVDNMRLYADSDEPTGPVDPTETSANFTLQNSTICINDCINIMDASTGTNISAWDWTFDGADVGTATDQNPSNICYSTPGTYNITLTITDDNGTDTQTKQINVIDCDDEETAPPVAIFVVDTNTVCAGDCISFTDLSTGNPTYWEWTFEGGNPSTSNKQNPSKICFDEPGTYDVTLVVANAYGTDEIITSINVLELPEVIGYGDTLIEMLGTAVIEAEPIDAGYLYWEPENEVDCDNCLTVEVSPLVTTKYYPALIGANGCIGRDTITVSVIFHDVVDVPSAFSPNGDGVNDVLRVLGPGITSLDFRIYNRYGQLIFQTDDQEEGWDGTFEGKELNQGIFAYTLTYELVDKSKGKKSGNVTLVK